MEIKNKNSPDKTLRDVSWDKIRGDINDATFKRSTDNFNKEQNFSMFSRHTSVQTEKISASELTTSYLSSGNQTSEFGAHNYNISNDNKIRTPKLTRHSREDGIDMIDRLNLPNKYFVPEPLETPRMTRGDIDE